MTNEKSVIAVIRAARPCFKNNPDKVVFAVHASFLAAGYVLIATGPSAFSDSAFYTSSTEEVGIETWNDSENEYAFVYANPDKGGKKVLLKCLVINDNLLLDALADGVPDPAHLEIRIGEFVRENGGTNISDQFKNLDELVRSIDADLLSKLDDSSSSLRPTSSSNQSGSGTSDGSKCGINEPGVGPESIGSQILPSGIVIPPINPNRGSDIFPGPGAGMYPTRGGFVGDGSMLIGPNDPRWFGGDPNFPGGNPNFPGGLPGVPPGSRFDPYGPPGVPGFEPNRFARNRPRPGRGTHPDLEHFGGGSDFI
ncbi:probable proteasome inhibitor isoform X2 [Ricinus communis]|uniref:Proteasome inhibitor, putative n=1 Tax=Ricinus communis TaxID=3988 RepID=B9T883_RICCO|nr:probable proteasome inhibitor isoform X2 [Ricinus communis]EEF27932.1 proteasome inhibitor, putative [Ricinus communis]|eukprot:XP_002534452.1 probable proteasome inhibitor isoform X2 [Ricinus communis]